MTSINRADKKDTGNLKPAIITIAGLLVVIYGISLLEISVPEPEILLEPEIIEPVQAPEPIIVPEPIITYTPAGKSKYDLRTEGFGVWEAITVAGEEAAILKFNQAERASLGGNPAVAWIRFRCRLGSMKFDIYNDDIWTTANTIHSIEIDGVKWFATYIGAEGIRSADGGYPKPKELFAALLTGTEAEIVYNGSSLVRNLAKAEYQFPLSLKGITKASQNLLLLCNK